MGDTCCTGTSRRAFLRHASTGALAAGPIFGAGGVAAAPAPATMQGPAPMLRPFDLRDVTLTESPFLHAQRKTEAYIRSLQPDRLLHHFRVNAGLAPKAPPYGGWESEPMWADINCHGHTLGHYLTACALAYRSTGEPDYRRRIDYIAGELALCQQAANSGLVCAFPDGARLIAAHLRGERITGVPWYTLHKVYAGLRDGALLADSEGARSVLLRFADWGVVALRPLNDAQVETMLETEHGGMSEIYADCYAMTGNADYRTTAERFAQKAILTPLAKERDYLDGLHANTQIPKIIGYQRLWEVTGKDEYRTAADFFWRTVAQTRSFATGGHGDNEHFFAAADFADHVFSAKGSETCCQHNMLRLTRALFLHDPQVAYADYYERTLYNGILASQDPDTGMATYFQGARPGYMKLYHTPEDSFWCCTGTGMENHVKYRDSIYFAGDDALYVNLFIPSAVRWRAKGATITQVTRFPDTADTRLRWSSPRPVDATIRLRHPAWSDTATVRVNGVETIRSTRPGRYIDVARHWRQGDEVELRLSMRPAVHHTPAAPDIVAFTYGPLVLAGALGRQGLAPGADIIVNERKYGEYNDTPAIVPVLKGDPDTLAAAIQPGSRPLEFTIPAADGTPVRLVPYHRIAHERYATYWKLGDGHTV